MRIAITASTLLLGLATAAHAQCFLRQSADGTYEDYICWTDAPVFSDEIFFAECFDVETPTHICNVLVDLSCIGQPGGGYLNCGLVGTDANGLPDSNEICAGALYFPVPTVWPEVTRISFDFSFCPLEVQGKVWIMVFEASQPIEHCSFVFPVDTNGPGGCPLVQGRNYPWVPPEAYFGMSVKALPIAIETEDMPVPTKKQSWGALKSRYQ